MSNFWGSLHFIYNFNLFVDEEQKILFKLLMKEKTLEGFDDNNYFKRLEMCGFIYKIPNSNISLKERRLNDKTDNGFMIIGEWYPHGREPYLYALNKNAKETLQYLYDEKLIFQGEINE